MAQKQRESRQRLFRRDAKTSTRDACATLERPFRLAHIACASFEPGEFFEERERNLAYGSIALLGNDQFGLAGFFHTGFFVFLIELGPDEQSNQIGILLDRTRFAQIAQARFPTRALLWLAVQLRHHNDRNL